MSSNFVPGTSRPAEGPADSRWEPTSVAARIGLTLLLTAVIVGFWFLGWVVPLMIAVQGMHITF